MADRLEQPKDYADFCAAYVADHSKALVRIESHQENFRASLDELKENQKKTDESVRQIREKVFNGLSSTPKQLWAVLAFLASLMVAGITGAFALGGRLEAIDTSLQDHIQHYESGLLND